MLLSILGAEWGLARGYTLGLWGFAVTVLNLATIGLLEQVLPLREGTSLFRDRQAWNDIGHGILLTSVGRPIGSNLSILALAWLAGIASDRFDGDLAIWPTAWPFLLQLCLGLGIYSFFDYWKHRAYHAIDWLWWIHAIHHDTRQMHVLKAGRLHLLEGTIRFIIVTTPLLLLGAPADVFVWIGLWMNFEGNLNHSNLNQRFPSWFHYFIPTVQVHHIHHARERRLQDSNFSGVTSLWDVLFGTFSHPDQNEVQAFGIEHDPVPGNFFLQLVYPFRMGFSTLSAPTLPEGRPSPRLE
jgi:sterol desaturase/sphingolipid hydroxylase (fatty acid hydroxylase superfamily)